MSTLTELVPDLVDRVLPTTRAARVRSPQIIGSKPSCESAWNARSGVRWRTMWSAVKRIPTATAADAGRFAGHHRQTAKGKRPCPVY